MIDDLRAALERLGPRHRADLDRLVSIASISAQRTGIDECAQEVVALLEERGFAAQVHQTPGHPVVVARGGRADGPRLLFYEHYDVQPPDPVESWSSDPFTVTERDGRLYGRGVCDTKGHIVCRLAAVDACREVFGDDPIGYTFLVEGEEEIGSPNLDAFIAGHADELSADGCLWEFGGVDARDHPLITCGLKGILTLELSVSGPAYDLHSSYGAAVDNPLWRLAAAVSGLRDADGRVLVNGFYDDIRPLSDAERAVLASTPDPGPSIREEFGVDGFFGGAQGADLVRRLQTEPAVNVNGLHGGYAGQGPKTVLPARAEAKLDVRLVPDQNPSRVLAAIRAHLDDHGFGDVVVEASSAEAPGRTPLDDPFVALVAEAARDAYGLEPVLQVSSAGTGPAHPFRAVLGVPFASAGCGYPGSRVHAPDEHIRITDFDRGRLHSALVAARMAG